MTLTITLPWAPSVNHLYATFNGRRILSRRGRQYHAEVLDLFRARFPRHLALTGRLHVMRSYYPPDKRRRDIGNLGKVIDDALTKAGAWNDDCQIDYSEDIRCWNEKGGRIVVMINEYSAEEKPTKNRKPAA